MQTLGILIVLYLWSTWDRFLIGSHIHTLHGQETLLKALLFDHVKNVKFAREEETVVSS